MMRTLIVILLFIPVIAFSQHVKPDVTNPDGLPEKKFDLSVKKIAPGEIKFPFSSIKIIDNRFDTSKLGFVPVYQLIANKKTVGRKMIFKNGIAPALEKYYNEFYQNAFTSGDIKLLIVLKKFWFSGIDNEKNREFDILQNGKSRSFLYCKWEYYFIKGDVFMPVQRIDTVINGVTFESEINENRFRTNKKIFKLILNGLLEVFDFNAALSKIEKLPKKTWADIQQYNASYYNIRVLKDSVLQKGVYKNFNEFKNNTPSIVNFKEEKIRIRLNQYENYIEDYKGNRITNYWGYFTGVALKIGKYGNEKVYRKNNTFEFFIQQQYLQNNIDLFGGNNYKEKEVWIPYQIDMENGLIY